jgi:signal transduction histidine kinase
MGPVTAIGWRAHAALTTSGGVAKLIAPLSGSLYVEAAGELLWIGPPGAALHGRAILTDEMPQLGDGSSVRAVVDDVVDALARHRADDVVIDVDSELQAVLDPVAFDRALSNLVANALRHGEPPITVSAERRDRHLRVAVEDAGPGVPPELVPRLFDRFERGEEGAGSGLGLAIAKAYAHAHGGDIVYDNLTRGARFELVLPTNG